MLNSKRLQKIADILSDDYQHIWDCCCDHGLLGIELLQCTSATVHFVDCEAHLIDALEPSLRRLPQFHDRCRLHCEPVESLSLPAIERQLLIIAGVGGDTCISMVEALLKRHECLAMDIILCPVRQVEQLRATLAHRELGLLQECLVEERGRFYEVLYLRRFDRHAIAPVMQSLSPSEDVAHRRYVVDRLRYLSLPSQAVSNTTLAALDAYRALL